MLPKFLLLWTIENNAGFQPQFTSTHLPKKYIKRNINTSLLLYVMRSKIYDTIKNTNETKWCTRRLQASTFWYLKSNETTDLHCRVHPTNRWCCRISSVTNCARKRHAKQEQAKPTAQSNSSAAMLAWKTGRRNSNALQYLDWVDSVNLQLQCWIKKACCLEAKPRGYKFDTEQHLLTHGIQML